MKAIDSSVKNRWSWKWPHKRLELSLGKVEPIKYQIGDCNKKIDVPGTAWCMWYEDKISYGNNGKKHLMRHCVSDKRILERLKVKLQTIRSEMLVPQT